MGLVGGHDDHLSGAHRIIDVGNGYEGFSLDNLDKGVVGGRMLAQPLLRRGGNVSQIRRKQLGKTVTNPLP